MDEDETLVEDAYDEPDEDEALDDETDEAYPAEAADAEEEAYGEDEMPASDEPEAEVAARVQTHPIPLPVSGQSAALREHMQGVLGEEGAQIADAYVRALIAEANQVNSLTTGYVSADRDARPEWHRRYGAQMHQMLANLPEQSRSTPRSVVDAQLLIMRMEAEQEDLAVVMRRHLSLMESGGQPVQQRVSRTPPRAEPQRPARQISERTQQVTAPVSRPSTPRNEGRRASPVSDLMKLYGVSEEEARKAFSSRKVTI